MKMTPATVLLLSEEVERTYMDASDQLLVAIAKRLKRGRAKSLEAWKIEKLAEMNLLTKEAVEIMARVAKTTPKKVVEALSEAMAISLEDTEKILAGAAEKGLIHQAGAIQTSERVREVVQNYARQSTDKLNLVNTVMLNSTQTTYRQAVNTIADELASEAAKRNALLTKTGIENAWSAASSIELEEKAKVAQEILNTATMETNLGLWNYQSAVGKAIEQMTAQGITGFYDIRGHKWSAEAYVNMDIRTTVHNTAIAGQKARSADYGVSTFQVSTKSAARPLCAPWQGHILSWNAGDRGVVYDLHGTAYQYQSVYDTSYGEPAGLFGINCGHFPETFVNGYSMARYEELDPEQEERNAEEYKLSQEQRAMERDVRKEFTYAQAMKSAGLDYSSALKNAEAARKEYTAWCKDNGRTPRYNRTSIYGEKKL